MLPNAAGFRWGGSFSRYQSTGDGGATWHTAGTIEPGDALTFSVWLTSDTSGYALILHNQYELFRTDDFGRTWHLTTPFPTG